MRKKPSRPKNSKGLIPIILILGALVLAAGIIIGRNKIKFPRFTKTKVLDSQNLKRSSDRKFGSTQLDKEGTIDTPVFEDEIEGVDILAGGVVTKKLKSGITVYFIIPPDEYRVDYAEIGEFKALPSSEKHIPLYTDYSYGINVAIKGKILDEAYLIFDFSNGKKLEEFKKLAQYVNYCDYSDVYFNPHICAALIKIPSYQDTSSKYLAARPKFNSRGGYVDPEEHQPTYPQYSYYLGTDDLLILKITQNDYVVVQPNKPDLLYDLAKDTFEAFPDRDYSTEMLSILLNQSFTFADLKLLDRAAGSSSIFDLKSYFSNLYLQKLVKAQRQDPGEVLEALKKDLETNYPTIFQEWARNASRSDSVSSANLRRAFDTRLKGSAKALTTALKETRINLIKLREDLERTVPVGKDITRLTRAASILTGVYTYNPKTTSYFNLIPYAFAQRITPPPPQSYYPPIDIPPDDGGDAGEADGEAEKTEAEVIKSLNDLADAILEGNVSLPIPDILDNIGKPEVMNDPKLAEKWQKVLEEAIRRAMKDAWSNEEKLQAHMWCKQYMPDIAQIECANHFQENKHFICAIKKIKTHSLRVLAPTKDIELQCKALEEPEEPPLEPLKL